MFVFFAGSILFAGFAHAVLFLFRTVERASGYLALVCVGFGINILLPNTSGLPLSGTTDWHQES